MLQSANQQDGLVVELSSVAGDALLQRAADRPQGLPAMFQKFVLEAREAEFFSRSVRLFQESVGVKREDVSLLRPNLGAFKIPGRKNPQRHVGAFQLRYLIGASGKMKNRRVACKPDAQAASIPGNKAKRDKHVRLL